MTNQEIQEKLEKLEYKLIDMGYHKVQRESSDYGDYVYHALGENQELRINITDDGEWRSEIFDTKEQDIMEEEVGNMPVRMFMCHISEGIHHYR